MANIRDITGKNREFTGTDSVKLPNGTTGERVASGEGDKGKLRYNSTTNLAEYYNGTDWKPIDSPPTITTIALDGGGTTTAVTVDNEAGGDASLVINGSLFDTTAGTVVFEATSGSDVSMQSTTRTSANQFTVTFTRTDLTTAGSPYALKLTNGSGLATTLAAAVLSDESAPVFAQSAGSLGSVFDGVALSGSGFDGTATDSDGDTITFSISAGALPSGLSLNTSTGRITGTPSGNADSTFTFTVSAATTPATSTREFTITQAALPSGGTIGTYSGYRSHKFTSSGTWTNSGGYTSSVDYILVAGGGGGGTDNAGGGGAGGMLVTTSQSVTATTYPITIGAGGAGASNTGGDSGPYAVNGSNSTAFGATAIGGGGGGSAGGYNGQPGGSGGGGSGEGANGNGAPGTAGQGSAGGNHSANGGGGGGGKGGAGTTGGSNLGGAGGPGLENAYETGSNQFYAAGGHGGNENGIYTQPGRPSGIGGQTGNPSTQGVDGTGSGGGAGVNPGSIGSRGGNGICVIRYAT